MPDNQPGEVQALVDQVRAFMQQHRIRIPEMAKRAGISRHSLKGIIVNSRNPKSDNRERLIAAIAEPPPPREPAHADVVRAYWGSESSREIARRIGISGARVRAIAKLIGLTNGRDQSAAA